MALFLKMAFKIAISISEVGFHLNRTFYETIKLELYDLTI